MNRKTYFGALWIACVAILLSAEAPSSHAQSKSPLPTSPGQTLFNQSCASCHAGPNHVERAPDLKTLMEFTPESVYAAVTTGTMALPAQKLTSDEKRLIAEYLGGRPLDPKHSGSAESMSKSLPHQSVSRGPIGRAFVEWMERRSRQHSFRDSQECRFDRTRRSPVKAEVGFRVSEW